MNHLLIANAETGAGTLLLGFLLLFLGAACGGSFGLPSKFVKRNLPWETLWGPFFFFATILIPLTFGPMLVDGLYETYRVAGWSLIILPLAFGLLWGLGSMTLGLSFAFIGLSLAYAINYGGQIIVGSMGPLLIHSPETLATLQGFVIILGVLVCLAGVVACGRAGVLKSKSQQGDDASDSAGKAKVAMIAGLLLAFLSGALCACWAIAFSFGEDVMEIAAKEPLSNPAWAKSIPVTILILWGGSISACLYCVYKLTVNKTWERFESEGAMKAVFLAFCMALLHDGAVLLFGLGATYLGDLGGSVGYAVFMSFAIIIGNVNGFLTGEWKGAHRKAVQWIFAGIVVLIVGICILGAAKSMDAQAEANTDVPVAETVAPAA